MNRSLFAGILLAALAASPRAEPSKAEMESAYDSVVSAAQASLARHKAMRDMVHYYDMDPAYGIRRTVFIAPEAPSGAKEFSYQLDDPDYMYPRTWADFPDVYLRALEGYISAQRSLATILSEFEYQEALGPFFHLLPPRFPSRRTPPLKSLGIQSRLDILKKFSDECGIDKLLATAPDPEADVQASKKANTVWGNIAERFYDMNRTQLLEKSPAAPFAKDEWGAYIPFSSATWQEDFMGMALQDLILWAKEERQRVHYSDIRDRMDKIMKEGLESPKPAK